MGFERLCCSCFGGTDKRKESDNIYARKIGDKRAQRPAVESIGTRIHGNVVHLSDHCEVRNGYVAVDLGKVQLQSRCNSTVHSAVDRNPKTPCDVYILPSMCIVASLGDDEGVAVLRPLTKHEDVRCMDAIADFASFLVRP